ncbi:alanine racemase [Agromyces flavus]|uniref:Alanine racemase n=1 Tax=Agromyces flavus TaxID=589382 RepID=A0A1H1LRD8_9MICO|nr:alanine racemase [Agromyces flavus]MCP2368608.1 alanine racemase [Agromyces flavus]GGI48152.1 alanine racemase [Agromyces flavus]SDR77184.1 alanine racemase [Agromyces flavus]
MNPRHVLAPFREAVIDLDAVRHNARHLAEAVAPARVMAVVKADAYGHGAVAVARAAVEAGVDWLGVADLDEAIALRGAGIDAPLLAWLHDPDARFSAAISRDIDLGVSSVSQLEAAADAATAAGRVANVHLKLDTGLSRNGIAPSDWPDVVARAAELEREGPIRVRGLFSHLSNTSPDEDAAQLDAFLRGVEVAEVAGLRAEVRHIASTAAALRLPDARLDMVRIGIGLYGVPPFGDGTTAADLGLRPVMTLRGRIAAVRRVAAGTGASYGYAWRAERETTLALVPLGYADGVPRQASGRAEVAIGGTRHPVVGRIAMDQFLVDVGDAEVRVGDEVVLFGDPATGAPSADDWGDAADSIAYEIVTRVGARVPRTHVDAS